MATTCTLSRPSATCTNVLSTFNEDEWLASTGQAGHLFDGLTYLLQAAQEWKIQKEIDIKSPGYQAQVYSMDSVFLRSRALFEFFLGNGNNYCHARCLSTYQETLLLHKILPTGRINSILVQCISKIELLRRLYMSMVAPQRKKT